MSDYLPQCEHDVDKFFLWNEEDIWFVVDQHTESDFHSDSSLTKIVCV